MKAVTILSGYVLLSEISRSIYRNTIFSKNNIKLSTVEQFPLPFIQINFYLFVFSFFPSHLFVLHFFQVTKSQVIDKRVPKMLAKRCLSSDSVPFTVEVVKRHLEDEWLGR